MTLYTAALILVAGLSVFIAVAAILIKPQSAVSRNQTLGRLDRYIESRESERGQSADVRSPLARAMASIRQSLIARDDASVGLVDRDKFADQLERADIALRPTEYNALRIAAGLAAGLLVWLRFGLIVGAVVAVAIGFFGGRFLIGFRYRRRLRKFDDQLSNVTILMSNGLKAGYSFPQAMGSVAANAKPPASNEFVRCSREIQLGANVEEALDRMVERNPSEDLDLMMAAIQVQRVVGGNLAEILDTIANTIRERVRIKGEIRTLTAQARASGWIISLLPVAVAGFLTLVAPDYFTPMYTDTLGIVMIVVSLISMGMGIYFIRKIVNIRI